MAFCAPVLCLNLKMIKLNVADATEVLLLYTSREVSPDGIEMFCFFFLCVNLNFLMGFMIKSIRTIDKLFRK